MRPLRLLLPGSAQVGDLDDEAGRGGVLAALADLYAYPEPTPPGGWVRANMITTLDGSATGADGLSGGIGGPADRAVFSALRALADVVLVGAGTARAEGYRRPVIAADLLGRRGDAGQPAAPALAVVTRSGRLPPGRPGSPSPFAAPDAGALVVTCAAADVPALRRQVGPDQVIVAGEDDVDPVLAVAQLAARGLRRVLLEGGPQLLGRTVAAGRLDELCLTLSPAMIAGSGPRIAHGPAGQLRLTVAHLLECDGMLLGRWRILP